MTTGMADRIRTVLAAAGRRFWRALASLPDAGGWRFSASVGGLALAAMAAVGFSGGLYRFAPASLAGLPLRLVSVFFVPALSEEAVFRGLLAPDRSETPCPSAAIVPIAVTTAIFTGWHVVETLFLRHAAPVFLRGDFLACAAILGAGCAVIRWRTASLWPAVALHWLVVMVWQTWLGGPGIEALQ
jgi:predicted Abi (CAAX) family protease